MNMWCATCEKVKSVAGRPGAAEPGPCQTLHVSTCFAAAYDLLPPFNPNLKKLGAIGFGKRAIVLLLNHGRTDVV
jgi:hypothetical protein